MSDNPQHTILQAHPGYSVVELTTDEADRVCLHLRPVVAWDVVTRFEEYEPGKYAMVASFTRPITIDPQFAEGWWPVPIRIPDGRTIFPDYSEIAAGDDAAVIAELQRQEEQTSPQKGEPKWRPFIPTK